MFKWYIVNLDDRSTMMNAATWPKINYEFTFIAYICNISNPIKKKPHEIKSKREMYVLWHSKASGSLGYVHCGIQTQANSRGEVPWERFHSTKRKNKPQILRARPFSRNGSTLKYGCRCRIPPLILIFWLQKMC